MHLSKYISLYFTYLKIGLSRFQQPIFWTTGIFILVMGIAIGNRWLDLDILTNNNRKPVTEKPLANSQEDGDSTADIDNLPFLISDFNTAILLKNNSHKRDENSQSFLSIEDIIKAKDSQDKEAKSNPELDSDTSSIPSAEETNHFLQDTNDSLHYHNSDGKKTFLGLDPVNPPEDQPKSQSSSTGLDTEFGSQTSNLGDIPTSTNQLNHKNELNSLDGTVNGGTSGIAPVNNHNLTGEALSPAVPSNNISGYVDPAIANQSSIGLDKNLNNSQTSLNQISPNPGISTTGAAPITSSTVPNNTYTAPVQNPTTTNYTAPAGTVYYGGSYRVQQPNFGYGSYRSQQQSNQLPQPSQ